ncbi:phage portal protein [Bacillus cereus group sp. BfR-BA-01380]|uniref:phage portal protein n=1 Tax=Bacillus cereus group sp. BfR-BA-01380 TaxID=2920324 RepID=UPI001F57B39C|nr:phage portal protein [Bacillus cereus group sp. BfR-BA-01380]
MSFMDKIKNVFRRNKITDENFTKWNQLNGKRSWQNHDILANNETIFAAVSRLSNSLATLPLKLYQDFYPITNNRMADLMSTSPNPNMTSFDFIRTMEVFRDIEGNAYALKRYNYRFQVEALDILDPTRVEPVLEEKSKELYYEIRGDDGQIYYVHNMDMIHVKHIHTLGYKGIKPIHVLRDSIDYDAQVKEFSLAQMENGIKASFVLKIASNLSDDKKKSMLESFKSFYSTNGSGVIIVDNGAELKEITRDFIDTKVFEVERITRSRVATVYNIPPHMLGDFSGTNFSSMEQQSLEYVQNTLVPIVRMYEQEFNKKLLSNEERSQGLVFKFNVNALLRGDIQTRGEFYLKGIRSGWFKPNEVRAYEELPPEKGGDTLLISGDLYPIDTPVSERNNKKVPDSKGGGGN